VAFNLASPPLKTPLGDRDHTLGPADAPLVLVEYGDYQCPHCGKVYPFVLQLIERYGNRLRFAYRHFPLAKMHPQARLAAESAEAAAAQGKFWEMHGQLFTHQKELEPIHLLKYAEAVGLDINRFRQEVEAHTYAPRVQEDMSGGVRSGVNGTPTFFINGHRYNGAFEFDDLAKALDTTESGTK
jgi:protein-disulfide isomerase